MKVGVEISFSFKRDLPADIVLDLPDNADVITALRAFVRRFPVVENRIFAADGSPRRYVNALINGGNVAFKRGFRTALHDGDCLTILPPVGGG